MTFVFSTHDQRVINRARRVITLEDGKTVKLTRKEVVGENWYVNVGKDVMHDLGKDLHTKVAGDIFTTGAATYSTCAACHGASGGGKCPRKPFRPADGAAKRASHP